MSSAKKDYPFELFGDKKILEGKYLPVYETEYIDKSGNRRTWRWAGGESAVMIFPITPDQEVVLIRNFRIPLRQYVIELPAGIKDKPDESDAETAERELLEETGYRADTLISITSPWPPLQSHSATLCTTFAATDLVKERDISGDSSEDISLIKVPFFSLPEFYCSLPPSQIIDPRILAMYAIVRYLGITG